jgi:hypothetical protein
VREDGPTLPHARSYVSEAPGDEGEPGRTPTWPIDRGGHSQPSSSGFLMPLMLGASLILNVVLIVGILSILIFGLSGVFSQGSPPSGSNLPISSGSPAGSRLGSPSVDADATPTAVASPSPTAGWLQVNPTSVHLGCNGNQQTQFVVLANTGTASVQWQVRLSLPADQAGVSVSPNQGTLSPGSNMPVQIQNQTLANGPQGIPGQQGTIEFTPDTLDAGAPATLTYTTVGCR